MLFFLPTLVRYFLCSASFRNIQIDIYLEINGIKAHFFVRIGNMSICEHYAFVHDKLLLFAEQQEMGMPAHSKKFEAFNNMHLIACRDRITEEIRLEICQKFQKAILQ